jgi:lipoprotein-anchoring transpeptidase ErfK/SrfK
VRRRLPAAALAAAICLLATACQGGKPTAVQLNPTSVAGKSAQVISKYLAISPAPGTRSANPAGGITVKARNGGKLGGVRVHTGGDAVTGTLSGDKSWHSKWTLGVDETYTVTATGTDDKGHPITATSTFTTLTPDSAFHTQIFEGQGGTYGVGMPIMLTFDRAITNKVAVERSLQLKTSKPVVGAWHWDGDQAVYFRPRDYWPAYTTVSFTGHLNGVEGAPGTYGIHDLNQTFSIGQSVIAVASTTAHHTLIYVDGQLKYNWPISTGRTTMPTPDGTYLSVEKANPVRMIGGKKGTPGYYNELVNYAVRFTFSGDYYHSAPWSVVNQGVSNVSHGCVNLPPEDAQIYYQMAIPGDPITITNSPKAGKWDDGWTEWFLGWNDYLQGSATHMAVEASPNGSKFVSPSSLPADTASTPVNTAAAGNYQAG